MMRFAHIYLLALLILIPLLYKLISERNKPARIRFPLNIPKGVLNSHPEKILLFLKISALVFLILALARPQTQFRETHRKVSGVDIMMVMDTSLSMNIEDLGEGNRLDAAKRVMENFIKKRSADRIGFEVFSGEPLTLVPPTLDYGLLLRELRKVETGKLKDGTGIGDGLALAVSRLRNSKSKSRIIILLTDGENNVGQVDPLTAGDLAAGYEIKVYTIAIGKEGRVKMPIKQRGIFGNEVTTYQWYDNQLNPELLQKIASSTDGKFYRAEDESALSKVFSDIDRLEKTEIQMSEKVQFDEDFAKPLVFALFLLVLEYVLSRFWWRVLP